MVRKIFLLFGFVVIAVLIGLLTTFIMLTQNTGFDVIQIGPWIASPMSGTIDADPYTKAAMARSGQIPLGIAEGMSFIAKTDSAGHALNAACSYYLREPEPPARVWTLTLLDKNGMPFQSADDHSSFTSQDIVRSSDGRFVINMARSARPSNWMQLPPNGRFILMLRLYDSSVSLSSGSLHASDMPRVELEKCL
jgi:hypothetical protein